MHTAILTCVCDHKYQDEVYGKQKRLCNVGSKQSVCTVCGKHFNESSMPKAMKVVDNKPEKKK